MILRDFVEYILERLGREDTAVVIFGADEIANCSLETLNFLIKIKLLRDAQPAQQIECTGCEYNCTMPVHVFPAEDQRLIRAFISCDKRGDIGRVTVDIRQLRQWEMTGTMLAAALAEQLNLAGTPHQTSTGKYWILGLIKGKENNAKAMLVIDQGVFISIANHKIPLTELLIFKNGEIEIDRNGLIKCVNQPKEESEQTQYLSSTDKKEDRKRGTQAVRRERQQAFVNLKKKHPHLSITACSELIAKMPIGQNNSAATIRRNLKNIK